MRRPLTATGLAAAERLAPELLALQPTAILSSPYLRAVQTVAPAALEDPIRATPVVGQVVVVGDQKPFISALITLDTEMLPSWLANNGQDASMSAAEAARNPAVLAAVQRAIDEASARIGEIVFDLVAKVVGREVDQSAHQDLVREAVAALNAEAQKESNR